MVQPNWIRDTTWKGLIAYWSTDEYAKKLAYAKANQASDKGGALHTTGPIPHIEVVQNLALDLHHTLDPDEMVYVTRRHKHGSWVDERSKQTYTAYQEKIKEISSQGLTDETQSNDGLKLLVARTLGVYLVRQVSLLLFHVQEHLRLFTLLKMLAMEFLIYPLSNCKRRCMI